jgi:uncharacterized membrane protein YkgB
MDESVQTKDQFEAMADLLIRYGLVLVIAWIGAMKFTSYAAHGIRPLVDHSPLLAWMYKFLDVQTFSNLLGVVEIAIASLIALRPVSPKLSAIGSASAVLMFFTTLSFLFSTPGWEPSLEGFPALSVLPGQFLLKDLVLLGAAFSTFAEAARNSFWKSYAVPPVLPPQPVEGGYELFRDQSPDVTELAKGIR